MLDDIIENNKPFLNANIYRDATIWISNRYSTPPSMYRKITCNWSENV